MGRYFLVAGAALSCHAAVDARPVVEAFGEAKKEAEKTICVSEKRAFETGPTYGSIWEEFHSPLWIAYDRCTKEWALHWWETKLGPDWKSHMMDEEAPLSASPSSPPADGLQPAAAAGTTVSPLRGAGAATGHGGEAQLSPLGPTVALEAHNPANEASDCLEPIDASAYDGRGVKSITGAVFRNTCAYPVETRWCVGADRCAKGYDNLATMPAKADRSISYDPPRDGTKATIHWAGCRMGFANRPDFAGTLQYACK